MIAQVSLISRIAVGAISERSNKIGMHSNGINMSLGKYIRANRINARYETFTMWSRTEMPIWNRQTTAEPAS